MNPDYDPDLNLSIRDFDHLKHTSAYGIAWRIINRVHLEMWPEDTNFENCPGCNLMFIAAIRKLLKNSICLN